MPTAIMVCSTASANQTASATTGFSAAALPHLLIAVLAIAGVMAMGAGGLFLFGSGVSIAPQSHVSPLPVIAFNAIVTTLFRVNQNDSKTELLPLHHD
jgi:hypothetical protein